MCISEHFKQCLSCMNTNRQPSLAGKCEKDTFNHFIHPDEQELYSVQGIQFLFCFFSMLCVSCDLEMTPYVSV